jgi:hypothetical protein
MSLFDTQDLAEITHPDDTGERLIACRNPALADEHGRKRDDLLAATGKLLTPISTGRRRAADRCRQHRDRGREVIDKYQVGKHFRTMVTDTSLGFRRDHTSIDTEAALDGVYVLRTSVPSTDLDPAAVVSGYKNLARIERDFRIIEVDDPDLRPIPH